MPFFALAIPVLHSSGAWIAYAGSSYLAGTLSSSWIAAFVLGNASWLSSVGLISAAGVAGATGVLSGLGASAAVGLGSTLSAIGLGGVASSMGIAPVATFLGLTPVGWALAGSAIAIGGVLTIFGHRAMRRINKERVKGGLPEIGVRHLIAQIKEHEMVSKIAIFRALAAERGEIDFSEDESILAIKGSRYSIERLRYVVNSDGSEQVVFLTKTGKRKILFTICGPKSAGDAQPI